MLKPKNLYPHPSRAAMRVPGHYKKAGAVLRVIALIVATLALYLFILNMVA